jgi:acetyl-CoA C-acetyltransferase
MAAGVPLRLQYKPVTRVENMCCTGSDALRNASYAVASRVVDVALAIGVEKIKDQGLSGLQGASGAGVHTYPNVAPPGIFAMLATRYFSRYGLSPEDGKAMIAKISVKSHHNGSLNPKAHLRRKVTVEQVLNAPIVAWPLGLFDCCGVSDGSAAAIVVRAEDARKYQGNVRSDWDYTHIEETFQAGQKAYAEAGIKNPREEISMAEVHDCFSITEALIMEDLQFSPRGRVKEDIESGFFELTGGLPVQPDGGLKSFGHPVGASGLRMMYEMYKQLQGKAGDRQIKDPKLGLTQNLGGPPTSPAIACLIAGL